MFLIKPGAVELNSFEVFASYPAFIDVQRTFDRCDLFWTLTALSFWLSKAHDGRDMQMSVATDKTLSISLTLTSFSPYDSFLNVEDLKTGNIFWRLTFNIFFCYSLSLDSLLGFPSALVVFRGYRSRVTVLSGTRVVLDGDGMRPRLYGSLGWKSMSRGNKLHEWVLETKEPLFCEKYLMELNSTF